MEKVRRTPASVKKLAEYFHMEILCKGGDYDTCVITVSDVFRPSLQLVGFYDYFDTKRLLILGKSEMRFLSRMTTEERTRVFNRLMSYSFPAMIISRNLEVFDELLEMAQKHAAPCCAPAVIRWTPPVISLTISIMRWPLRSPATAC